MSFFVFVTTDGNANQLDVLNQLLSVSGFRQSLTVANDSTFRLQANQFVVELPSSESVATRVRTAALVAGCTRCTVVMAEASNCATYDMNAPDYYRSPE